jgi:hypothetical protein
MGKEHALDDKVGHNAVFWDQEGFNCVMFLYSKTHSWCRFDEFIWIFGDSEYELNDAMGAYVGQF